MYLLFARCLLCWRSQSIIIYLCCWILTSIFSLPVFHFHMWYCWWQCLFSFRCFGLAEAFMVHAVASESCTVAAVVLGEWDCCVSSDCTQLNLVDCYQDVLLSYRMAICKAVNIIFGPCYKDYVGYADCIISKFCGLFQIQQGQNVNMKWMDGIITLLLHVNKWNVTFKITCLSRQANIMTTCMAHQLRLLGR